MHSSVLSLLLAATAAFVGLAAPSRALALAHPLPPPNDNFAKAAVYAGTSAVGNNIAAGKEPGERSHKPIGGLLPFHSVWWKFTPQLTGLYEVDTTGSNFDTLLAVYTGTTVSNAARVAANDDFGGNNTSVVRAFLTKGVVYHFAVDGFDTDKTGNIALHVKVARYYTVRTYQAFISGTPFDLNQGGMITFSVANTGAVTGRFNIGAGSYPFTSAMDETGVFAASAVRAGGLLPVSFTASIGTATGGAQGEIPVTFNAGPAALQVKIGTTTAAAYTAYPVAPGDAALQYVTPTRAPYSAAHPCDRTGRYPFYVDHINTAGSETGYGVAALVVSVTGACSAVGHLGDGTAFTFAATILDNVGAVPANLGNKGALVFHVPLYAAKGRISGAMDFDAGNSPATTSGSLVWVRPPAAAGAKFLPSGIHASQSIEGSLYTSPGKGARVDPSFEPTGTCLLNLLSMSYMGVSQQITLTPMNTFIYPTGNVYSLRLVVAPTTGALSGSVKLVGSKTATAIVATLVHRAGLPGRFYGYAPDPLGYGIVTISPPN